MSFNMSDLIESLEYSKRSEPVNYVEIKTAAVALLGKKFAFAWGVSLNLESLRKIDGRFVKIGEERQTYEEMLTLLQGQGSNAMREGIADPSRRIEIAKKVVTPSRLARAFAIDTIAFLKKKPGASPFKAMGEAAAKASGAKMPKEYFFLNAIYGLNEDQITKYDAVFLAFFLAFDQIIDNAVAEGWQKDARGNVVEPSSSTASSKRSWEEAYEDFKNFSAWENSSLTLLS